MANENEKRDIMTRLLNIDARIIYLCVLLLIAIPMINPIGLPLTVDPLTVAFKEEIDNLPPGSYLVVMVDIEAGLTGELVPQGIVLMNELFTKPLKFIQVCFYRADAPVIFETMVMPKVDQQDKVYGVDWVNIGYIEGGAMAQTSFAANFHLTGKDAYGTPLEDIPLMSELSSVEDVALLVSISCGSSGKMMNMALPYDKTFIAGVTAVYMAMEKPFVDAGQIKAMLNGMRGAAEYELITERPGLAIAGMDSVSLHHIFLIALTLMANVIFIYRRYIGGGDK